MPSEISLHRSGNCASLRLPERFDFNALTEFRRSYAPLMDDKSISHVELDCADMRFIDSSGLGLLLLLNEAAEAAGKETSIVNCDTRTRKLFMVANFHKLFRMQ